MGEDHGGVLVGDPSNGVLAVGARPGRYALCFLGRRLGVTALGPADGSVRRLRAWYVVAADKELPLRAHAFGLRVGADRFRLGACSLAHPEERDEPSVTW